MKATDSKSVCGSSIKHGSIARRALWVWRVPPRSGGELLQSKSSVRTEIGEFQMNQDLIAQMIAHEEAARLLVYRAAGSPINRSPTIWKLPSANTPRQKRRTSRRRAMRFSARTVFNGVFRSSVTTATPNRTKSSKALRTCKNDHRAGRAGLQKSEPVTITIREGE
jgi:hypothetical protein